LSQTAHGAAGRAAFRWSLPTLAATAALALSGSEAGAQITIPNNVKATCTVSATEFNGWFQSGTVTLNGIVDPADGLLFQATSLCNFYKWSEQMFLWLTSPAPPRYGQATHVFSSPVFYSVSPEVNGVRTLIPNTPGGLFNFRPFISQLGKLGKPVVVDSTGKKHTVIRAEVAPGGKAIARSANRALEIGRVELAPNNKPILRDKAGAVIANPVLRDRAGKTIKIAGAIRVNGHPMLIDPAGNAIETEEGQAGGGGVLMAQGGTCQNGQIVYYLLQVNDVWAYFLTGVKNNQISATQFPSTSAQISAVGTYAMTNGIKDKSIPDLPAMAIELKSAWIDVSAVANPSDYITIDATIPTYTTACPSQWNQTGQKSAKLALLGFHVVGTVLGHPEMLWATFEHISNTANAAYSYTDTSNQTQNVAQNTNGTFLFTPNGATTGLNPPPFMAVSGTGITATSQNNNTIGPTPLLRAAPWGTLASSGAFTGNNTDIISLNNSVISKLAPGDARAKYVHTGTVWTPGGQNPSNGNFAGATGMANTTMESFFQGGLQCFDCHSDPPMLGSGGGGLSHIYGTAQKLF